MKKIICIGLNSMSNELMKACKNISDIEIEFRNLQLAHEENVEKLIDIIRNEAHLIFVGNINEDSTYDSFFTELRESINIPIVPIGVHAIQEGYYNIDSSLVGEVHKYITYGGYANLYSAMNYICYNLFQDENQNKLEEYKKAMSEPVFMPFNGIIHKECDGVFKSFEEYKEWYIGEDNPKKYNWIGVLVHRSKWISSNLQIEYDISDKLEKMGYKVILAFSYATTEEKYDIKSFNGVVAEYYSYNQNLLINGLINFQMLTVSGELEQEDNLFDHEINNFKKLNIPVFKPIISYSYNKKAWEESVTGISNEVTWAFTTPEMVGMIEPIIVGCRGENGEQVPIEEGIIRLVKRVHKWTQLRVINNKDKKVTIMIHNLPCSGVEATIGRGVGLDVFNSIINIMKELKEQGYYINQIPKDGSELRDMIIEKKAFHDFRWTSIEDIIDLGGSLYEMSLKEYNNYYEDIPQKARDKIEEMWGKPLGEAMVHNNRLIITGLDFGNIKLMVQPKRGCYGAKCTGEVCKILHDPTCPPPHQYIATYRYIEYVLKSNAIINVGTGGSLEFLPGKSNALSYTCFPYISLGGLPSIYVYNASVGGEGTIAKRRGNSVIIDHMPSIIENIWNNKKGNLHELGKNLNENEFIALMYEYMYSNDEAFQRLKLNYEDDKEYGPLLTDLIKNVVNKTVTEELINKIQLNKKIEVQLIKDVINNIKEESKKIKGKCSHMYKEIDGVINALNGCYIEAGLSGSPSENLERILPTGRNMHLMDSDRIPTKEAYEIGVKLGNQLIDRYKEENQGNIPEKVAMNMISTDISGAKGEQLSQILYLMGAKPYWNKWGKVIDIEIISLEELKRPRIDVTVRISGVLRDSYPKAVAIIDKAALMVSNLDEPLEKNYIKRNTLEIKAKLKKLKQIDNLERRSTIRVFGDKPGAYGAGVDLALKASAWKVDTDIAKIFAQFSSYAYGDNLNGKLAKNEFVENIKGVDASYEVTNSKRFNSLNSCFVASVHGGFNAVKKALTGKDICQYHGSSENKNRLRVGTMKDELKKNLEETLCDPLWKERMKEDGYNGAGDIMKAIQTVFDWQVLLKKFDDTDIDKVVNIYINDDKMRKWFEENNKYALEEIGRRFLEMNERKVWNADEEVLKKLKRNYIKAEGDLEETIENCGDDIQTGNIEVLSYREINSWSDKLKEFNELFEK